jgi:hypothetical protein
MGVLGKAASDNRDFRLEKPGDNSFTNFANLVEERNAAELR